MLLKKFCVEYQFVLNSRTSLYVCASTLYRRTQAQPALARASPGRACAVPLCVVARIASYLHSFCRATGRRRAPAQPALQLVHNTRPLNLNRAQVPRALRAQCN